MQTLTLTINEQTKAGNSLLTFLKSLDFVSIHDTGEHILSGKQAASECNAVPLDFFISELHRKVNIGLEQSEKGIVSSEEEVSKRLSKWLA